MVNEQIIERLKRLRSLQTSDNEHEAAAAAKLAARLIQKYRISEAELESPTGAGPIFDEQPVFSGPIPTNSWITVLAVKLAEPHGCVAYLTRKRRQGRQVIEIKLVGRASDVEFTRNLFAWFSQTIFETSKRMFGDTNVAWCLGCVCGIEEAILAGQQQAAADAGTSTAIAVLDGRLEESQKAFESGVEKVRKTRAQKVSDQDEETFVHGMHAGRSMAARAPTRQRS